MRALVQRVARAAVRVEGAEVAAIGPGLLVLLGVTHDDTEAQADRLADKLRALRIFPDAEQRMNEPLGDREVPCVSQFTLYGDARRGNRPSYVDAARPEHAEPLYERVCERLGGGRGARGSAGGGRPGAGCWGKRWGWSCSTPARSPPAWSLESPPPPMPPED